MVSFLVAVRVRMSTSNNHFKPHSQYFFSLFNHMSKTKNSSVDHGHPIPQTPDNTYTMFESLCKLPNSACVMKKLLKCPPDSNINKNDKHKYCTNKQLLENITDDLLKKEHNKFPTNCKVPLKKYAASCLCEPLDKCTDIFGSSLNPKTSKNKLPTWAIITISVGGSLILLLLLFLVPYFIRHQS